jgi:gamma-glutamyltranspeptidase
MAPAASRGKGKPSLGVPGGDGEIAHAIIETQKATRTDTLGPITAGVGRMTLDDLENYDVAIRRPVADTYRGYTIKGMGLPSSGALTVLQMLKMVERFPIGDAGRGFGFGSPRTLNVMSVWQCRLLDHDDRVGVGYRADGTGLWVSAQQRADRL